MNTQPHRTPLDYITITATCKSNDTIDKDDDRNTLESLILGHDSYDRDFSTERSDLNSDYILSDESQSPPWPLIGSKGIEPSLARTFDSDSASIISDVTATYPKYAKSSLSAATSASEYSTRSKKRLTVKYDISSQDSSKSNRRVQELKAKRRSIELQCYRQKYISSKTCMVQSADIDTSYRSGKFPSLSKIFSSHCNQNDIVKSLMQIMEAVMKIICLNIMLCIGYLLFMFYTYSFSMVIQGCITLFCTFPGICVHD